MKADEIIAKIQTMFRVAKGELLAVVIAIIGVTIAAFSRGGGGEEDRLNNSVDNTALGVMLAGFAEKNQGAYIGSNVEGVADSNLVSGDTIIEKDSKFPKSGKKALPAGTKININTASKAELMKLPGIGDAMANRIIEYRKDRPFKQPADFMKVKGIGEKKFEKIKAALSI